MLVHRQPGSGSAAGSSAAAGGVAAAGAGSARTSPSAALRGPRRTSPADPCRLAFPATDVARSILVFPSASYSAGPAKYQCRRDRRGYRRRRDPRPCRMSMLFPSWARRRRGCPQAIFRRSPVRRAPRLRMGPLGIRWPHCSCRAPAAGARRSDVRGALRGCARRAPVRRQVPRSPAARLPAPGGRRWWTCRTRHVPVAWKERGPAAPGRASRMPRIRALKGAGETSARGSRRSSRRCRLWGTLAVAQCSSHGNACPCATMCEPWRISSNVENADAPPR